jgi:hypothetical protein
VNQILRSSAKLEDPALLDTVSFMFTVDLALLATTFATKAEV